MNKMYNSLRLLLVLLLGLQAPGFAQTAVFSFATSPQYYTVPARVTEISVSVKGAQGGVNADLSDSAGYGAIVTAVIAVTPGQVLQINTGGCGGPGTTSAGGAGGFNGGGNGSFGVTSLAGGGGGGLTDIRMEPYDFSGLLVVAGGGGGAGATCGGGFENGGGGGANLASTPPINGADGKACGAGATGGGGGNTTTLMPGLGGSCSCLGSAGTNGALLSSGFTTGGSGGASSAGGGGGGGYAGGGGGQWSGGGGGSDYYGGPGVYVQNEQRGANRGCGSVTITPYCRPGALVGPDSVCSGSTITLVDTGGTGCITWTTASTITGGSSSTIVSHTCTSAVLSGSFGVDTVIAIFTGGTPGCIIRFPVTINPVPNIVTYPGYPSVPSAICVGQTLQLSELSTGGTWSSSSPAIATVGSGGLVTGVAAGIATISYTFSTGCTAVVVVTVNPLPDVPSGADSMCLASSTTLSSTIPGILWTTIPYGSPIVNISSGGIVTGLVAGTVQVCDSIATTGCRSCVNVTVNPVPGLPTPASGCVGVLETLTSSPTLAGTWSTTGSALVATVDPLSGVINPISTGTVTVTFTTIHGCSNSVTFTVNPNPSSITGTSHIVCGCQTLSVSETVSGSWTLSPATLGTITSPGSTASFAAACAPYAGGSGNIVFHLPTGCIASYPVTVNPQPANITVSSGQNPVCTGNCATFASGSGGVWAPTTGLIGTIDATTGVFCAVTTSTVSATVNVTYTNTVTGCFNSLTVSVNPAPVLFGPDSVCKGNSVLLCALPAGGTWTQSRPAGTITTISTGSPAGCETIFGEAPGLDTLTYSRLGCTTVAIFTVNPVVSVIGLSKNTVCNGDTATAFATPAGGTWASSNPGLATIDPVTGVITTLPPFISGGFTTLTYTTAGGCTAFITLTVNGLPGPIPPPHAVCVTAGLVTIPLPSPSQGAGTWSLTNPAIGTIDPAGNFTPMSVDTSTICYTVTSSGCFSCDTIRTLPAPSSISGPSSVCEGFTISLTDPDGTSTWSVSNTSATIGAGTGILTGQTAGVDTVRFTNGGGCFATKTVTVHASPAPITGGASVCQGQCTTLRDATGGGFWQFSPSSGVVTVSPTFGSTVTTVCGVGAGIAIVDYTQGFFGCYAQVTVTVTSGVPAITGPNTLCQGSSAVFSDFGAPGTGTWSSSNVALATTGVAPGLSTLVTADAAGGPTGVATITFQSTTGCTATKDVTINLTPPALITPLGRTDLCPGDNAVLTATTGVGFTYVWTKGGVPIVGATNSTYITNVPGIYRVTITLGSCSATSNAVNVTMNPITAGISPSGTIITCASTAPTLNATPTGAGYIYQWISGTGAIAGATAATYVASVNGTFSVLVTNPFGCSSTSPTATITLRPSPSVSVSPSTVTICVGSSFTLTGTASGGTSYQWNFNGLPIAGATNLTFVASNAGIYTLTVSNGTCATISAGVPLGVVAAPAATVTYSGDTTVCATALTGPTTVTLNATPAGPAYTYQWYRGGVAVTGATGVTYIASVSGSYTVKVTAVASGCSATSTAQGVNVIPVPSVSPLSATSFCWGGSVRLSVSATTVSGFGISYLWTRNGVTIPGVTGPSYTATTSGRYAVDVTFASGIHVCGMDTRTVTVTEYPMPNPRVTFDGTYFHVGSFVTYQWYKNTIAIPGATTSAVHNSGIGSYSVRITDVNGCQAVSPAYVLTYIPPAPPGSEGRNLDQVKMINDAGNIRIYPNPAQNMVHIEADMVVRAVITGIDGRTIIDQPAAKDISLDNVADGVYIIKLFNTDGVLVRTDKLVKTGGR